MKEELIKMSVQVENLEKNMAKLTIEVSAEELEKALQGAYSGLPEGQSAESYDRENVWSRHLL